MNMPALETKRLLLRRFRETDIDALYQLLQDEEVNTFLPWFPMQSREEAELFYQERIAAQYRKELGYFYAISLKETDTAIGYVAMSADDSHDFGYALRKEYWHKGIVTEAALAVLEQLKKDRIPYITATHDRSNPRSGAVMKKLGMTYRYSYVEQWQPKNIPVTFRMYQLNLDGQKDRTYLKYWNRYTDHFVETDL